MPTVGPTELAIILTLALIVFGPKRLPALGRSLGSGLREFKDSVTQDNPPSEDRPAAVPSATASPRIEDTQAQRPFAA